ncbi:single-stranded-DNA-specific exonuclease RecJ [Methylocapsa sp. S129]|uniref:single-stranded-DNA-specific exonuclease RecJ n=1 Tax=Methylocapsa sp. S129 TaxID=1641869 RepID=UPI00131B7219|nr:single-stranded-DNA-specific exonuclease RecJ [Methylocapsa sp. S129]
MSFFLDVERSVLGRPWRARLNNAGEAQALAIGQVSGQSDLMARVLAGRGVKLEEVALYLDPTLRDLMPDPFTLRDMEPATARLALAVKRGEKIAVFGDYDVDGATSAALLAQYLNDCGCETIVHIPDRVIEGYGPNVEAMRAFAAQGAKLVVTVDCGAVSHEPFAEARRLGLDVIVFDHHQAPELLPDALALVDPNRQDDLSGLGYLCAAGVVYMALVALNRALREAGFWNGRAAPDLIAALDLVALGTVADVVPLTGLNRAFVVKGLSVMRARRRPGLAALLDVAGADGPPRPYHLGFLLGPRINAGGRIGDSGLGVKLLMTRDDLEARGLAAELDRLNRARQQIEIAMLESAEAEALLALGLEERGACVVVAGEGWRPGIVGIVAARLKERFNRPAFVLALNGAEATGSGRSIAGVDLGRVVRAAVEAGVIVKGGGHAMAAGVTLARDRLGDFRAFMEERLAAGVGEAQANASLEIDSALTASAATPALVHSIERAGPYGAGNPEPVFVLPRHRLVDVVAVGADHLRVRAASGDNQTIEAIAFRAANNPLGEALKRLRGSAVHLAGALTINRYGGREKAQLRLLDAAVVER